MKVGDNHTIDVATGNDPTAAVGAAMLAFTGRPQVFNIGVAHDDGCPSVEKNAGMPACTCEIVQIHVRRVA